jgi:hypothetical protein
MAKSAVLKMKPAQARRAGEQGLELVKKDKAKLQGRLEAGVLEGLAEDVRLLGNQTSSALTARVQKKAATQEQNEVAEELSALVGAVRSVLKLTAQETAVRKAAGVGRKLTAKSVKTVLAAADMVIEAYGIYADAMRAAGVLPADVDTLIGKANALAAADQVQEGRKVASKLSTVERNKVQKRVEAGLMKLIAAAEMQFVVADPERVALYKALVPARSKKRKPRPTPIP